MIKLSAKTQRILHKKKWYVRKSDRDFAVAEVMENVRKIDELKAKIKAENPFWFYEPVTGDIPGERKAFLKEYLKEEDIPQKLHGAVDVHLSTASIRGASGGNQCICGNTEIFDPVIGKRRIIKDISEDFHVYAWSRGRRVIAKANIPFQKGIAPLYRIKFSNGQQIVCTSEHRLLTQEGWKKVHEVRPESCLVSFCESDEEFYTNSNNRKRYSPSSLNGGQRLESASRTSHSNTLDCSFSEYAISFLLSNQHILTQKKQNFCNPASSNSFFSSQSHADNEGVRNCSGTTQDSQFYYQDDYHSDGEHAHYSTVPFRGISPLQGDVQKYISNCGVYVEPDDNRLHEYVSRSTPYVGVTSISYERTDVYYDFNVPIYHNYIVGNVVSHNSSKTTTGTIEGIIKATGALPFVFDPTKKEFKYSYPAKRLIRNGPQHVRVIGEDYQNGVLRNLIPAYRKWTPKEYLLDNTWERSFSAGECVLRLYDPKTKQLCGTIEFMSNKQDLGTFQGPPRHMIIYDEEPDHEIYLENLMRFTTASSLDVLFCQTPTKGMSWTYDLFTRGEDGSGNNVAWFQIPSVCNPHANLKVLREVLDEMESYEQLKMRILGEFVSLSGLVYGKLFQHSVHVIPAFDTACNCGASENRDHNKTCPYSLYMGFLGIDPHMVKPSDAVLCAIDREDNFYVDTCYEGNVTVEELKKDLADLCEGRRMAKSVADPSSDSSLTIYDNVNVFELLKRGKFAVKNLVKADKFQGSIAAGISNIKERLKINAKTDKPRFFIFDRPENKKLIKTFKTLQRETWSNEQEKGLKDRIAEGVHDHHACVRYLLQRRFSWRPAVMETYELPISDEEALVA